MPRIFDNINDYLNVALRNSLEKAHRADFCVGYFNLRGWKEMDAQIEAFSGEGEDRCRLLVGMTISEDLELRRTLDVIPPERIDNRESIERKRRLAESFRRQLCYGVPTDADEAGLRRLLGQLRAGKVVVKLFTRHPLHAKLYLAYRQDADNPMTGYVGSSNLTFAGLGKQGELNVDVVEHDAARKLAAWFKECWEDRFCADITQELIEILEQSWAREELIPPYHIYLKMAYVLSQEARTGIAEEVLPEKFEQTLFPYQKDAVKIAASRLKERKGVLIGDVVGLGKTITATAVASLFNIPTLVICPKNLEQMWKDYAHDYVVPMEVLPISQAARLINERRHYGLVIVDESHNLRNREGQRYRYVREYIEMVEPKVILLSATPYNKTYQDLASQLRLFVDPEMDLGIAPEALIREKGQMFLNEKECRARTLRAFELSEYADDWRELMRLYLLRRTRSFIKSRHTKRDPENNRDYLLFSDGRRSYFPVRRPRTLAFKTDPKDSTDLYAQLYSDAVAKPIAGLALPRYGLGVYENLTTSAERTPLEREILQNLSRGGKRLMGFCRVGLFKRLESSGNVFIQSLERHILRNFIFLHAIENNLPLPIGSQDVEMLDARITDTDEENEFDWEDSESSTGVPPVFCESGTDLPPVKTTAGTAVPHSRELRSSDAFRQRAADVYDGYRRHAEGRFQWIESRHFTAELARDLQGDADTLIRVLQKHGQWDPMCDNKLKLLKQLVARDHGNEKVLVFTQFADTARYLAHELQSAGVEGVAAVTGDTDNPTAFAYRFSPQSNNRPVGQASELRVLVATDVLSEGQNLQDAHVIVNYDLPWAIIRLIQRAGRVDRIGQKHDEILCYSFLPADGVENIIRLRERVKNRLNANAEVVGSDEAFFEDQESLQTLDDLYHEKEGILDGDEEGGEVDLASEAYQIWKDAIDADPALEKIVPALPDVVYSARPWKQSGTGVPPVNSTAGTAVPHSELPEGVVVFLQTAEGNCALAWMDTQGRSVTESQHRIMRAARCQPDTPALPHAPNHHELTGKGVKLIIEENRTIHNTAGTLGSRHGIRYRVYEAVRQHLEHVRGEIFDTAALRKALQLIYENPLTEKAKTVLGQHLKIKSSPQSLGSAVQALYEENELCLDKHRTSRTSAQLICSLGLRGEEGGA